MNTKKIVSILIITIVGWNLQSLGAEGSLTGMDTTPNNETSSFMVKNSLVQPQHVISSTSDCSNPSWAKSYSIYRFGIYSYRNRPSSVIQTTDGGYLVGGISASTAVSGDFKNVSLLKLDAFGEIEWQKSYGRIDQPNFVDETLRSLQQTDNGGYILASETRSITSLKDEVWILKLDANGNQEWQSVFSDSESLTVKSINQTADGGYILSGNIFSQTSNEIYILKLDANGLTANGWPPRIYGGTTDRLINELQPTNDGGYIFAGRIDDGAGKANAWVVKTDANGDEMWNKTFGEDLIDETAISVKQTINGDYIVLGRTTLDILDQFPWVLKLDSTGTPIWQNSYIQGDIDVIFSASETDDGDFVLAGYNNPTSGAGRSDVWMLKIDVKNAGNGAILWQNVYGGTEQDTQQNIINNGVRQSSDGGYIVISQTESFGMSESSFWVIKTDTMGDVDFLPTSGAQMASTTAIAQPITLSTGFSLGTISSSSSIISSQPVIDSRARLDIVATVEVQAQVEPCKFLFNRFLGGSGSEYLGGAGFDNGGGVTIDDDGNIYLTGYTASDDFPVSSAPYDPSHNGVYDVFLVKLNPSGNIIWSSYLGGSGLEVPFGLALDNYENIVVTGHTESTNFPTLNAYDPSHNGESDAFLTKFDSDGNLLWSSFIGGDDFDKSRGITIGNRNQIFIVGETWSTNFPTTPDAYQTDRKGHTDAFVAQFSSEGELDWSTLFGGSSKDMATGVDSVDPLTFPEYPVITGTTWSSDLETKDAYQSTLKGGTDIFIAEIIVDGERLGSNTYIGGSKEDRSWDLVLDSQNRRLVTGFTKSDDFPTPNGHYTDYGGSGIYTGDAFVLQYGGDEIFWSTFLGGSDGDIGTAVAVDSEDHVTVTGWTKSVNFPVLNAQYPDYQGDTDAFVAKIASHGGLIWNTFLGGNSGDYGADVVLDSSNNIIIAGSTSSTEITFPEMFNTNSGERDAFISYLIDPGIPVPPATTGSSSSRRTPFFDNSTMVALIIFFSFVAYFRKGKR